MKKVLFVVQLINPGGKPRNVMVLAQCIEHAAGTADHLKRPGEKVSITEAHEPVYESFGFSEYNELYAGLEQPDPGQLQLIGAQTPSGT